MVSLLTNTDIIANSISIFEGNKIINIKDLLDYTNPVDGTYDTTDLLLKIRKKR